MQLMAQILAARFGIYRQATLLVSDDLVPVGKILFVLVNPFNCMLLIGVYHVDTS